MTHYSRSRARRRGFRDAGLRKDWFRWLHDRWHEGPPDGPPAGRGRRAWDDIEALEEYQRDLEQRAADVAERIRRLREERDHREETALA